MDTDRPTHSDDTHPATERERATDKPPHQSLGLTSAAAALAYAGALPLVLAAVIIWTRPPEDNNLLRELTILYGGLLVAFFGGVRWGVAVMRHDGPTFRNLIGAIVPLLLAVPVFLMTMDTLRLVILVVGLPVLLIDDLRETRSGSGAPEWYLSVRLPLTIMMVASLFAILLRTVFW